MQATIYRPSQDPLPIHHTHNRNFATRQKNGGIIANIDVVAGLLSVSPADVELTFSTATAALYTVIDWEKKNERNHAATVPGCRLFVCSEYYGTVLIIDTNPSPTQTAGPVTATQTMQTLAPTTAELLIEYNTTSINDDATECVRAIISGDLSGPIPLKADKICGVDVTGQVFPRPLLAPKPGKLTPLQAAAEFVSTDAFRPAMCGVYHHTYTDCGQTLSVAVGTCGHTLGVFPAEAPAKTVVLHAKTFEKLKAGDKIGRFQIYENYSEKNDRYPEYQMAIPIVGKNGPAYQVTDVQGLRNILAGILRACAFIQDSFMLACIQHNSESFYFQPEFVARALRTMQATGTTRLQLELSTPNRAMVLRDVDNPEKLALVMPIMYNADDFRPWALLLDTYAGQATVTIPVPVKRITVKKPTPEATIIAELAAANVVHETAVIEQVAEQGEMSWSDAQGLVDFGSFDYMQCLTKGLTPTETAKVLLSTTAPKQNPLAFIHQGVSVYHVRKYADDPNSRILGFHFTLSPDGANSFDVRELFGNSLIMERDEVGHELRRAIYDGRIYTPAPAHQEAAYISASPSPIPYTTSTIPAPKPTVMVGNKAAPFIKLTLAGDKVRIVHLIGKCAVGHVTPKDPMLAPYYCLRFRNHIAQCDHFDEVPRALGKLRDQDNAEIRRENELISLAGFPTGPTGIPPTMLRELYTTAGLDPRITYPRRVMRTAIIASKHPKFRHYLAVLAKASPTKPARI